MFNISKKISERISKGIPKFQKVLKIAKDRDVNESDTVSIINDMLGEIFGYDKYLEVTSELAIRGTYCDLAIKLDDKIHFLIECKAIGLELKDAHLKQAIDYGANKGVPWVILTNGIQWNLYRIRFEQPINYDLIFSINIDKMDAKTERDIETLYVLTKEGLEKNARDEYFDKIQCVNKYIIGNLILSENVINAIKKELRKFAEEVKIEGSEIVEVLEIEIIKREILDSDDANIAKEKLKKFYRKVERQIKKKESDFPINEKSALPSEENVSQAGDASETV